MVGFLKKLFGSERQESSSPGSNVNNITDAGELCNLGNTYFRKQQYAKAIEIYNKALTIDPEHSIVLGSIGAAYQESNQLSKAIEALNKAIHINPEYDTAWYNLGNAYYKSNEIDKAADAFQQAIRISPGHVYAKHNLELCRQALNN